MKSLEELKTYYAQELVPDLEKLEVLRKSQVKRQVFIIVALLVSVFAGVVTLVPLLVLVFLFISLFVYFALFGFKRQRFDFKSQYKTNVFCKLIPFIEPQLAYTSHQYIVQSKYDYSKIFLSHPDIYSGEDMVEGFIDKTKIEFSELHTQDRRTDSKGRTTYVTIFRGIFFIADFNKAFSGQTYVLSDFSERFLGYFGKLFQNINISRPDIVRLEDPEFEKHFAVYSTDEVEARYILSPALMQRIMEFKKKTNSGVQLSFLDSSIYLAIPMRKNLFEPKLYKSVMNFNDIEEYYHQLQFCTCVVEDLNLNTRIWSKQ